MRVKKVVFRVAGMVMIMSLFAACGKNNNDSDNNKQTVESATYQEDNTTTQVSESKAVNSILGEQSINFVEFSAQIPKGYYKSGTGAEIVSKLNDSSAFHIAYPYADNKKILSNVNAEELSLKISDLMRIDDDVAVNTNAYIGKTQTTIESINDIEINNTKMKKFEGKVTVSKSRYDIDTKWDCYIYGYIFETSRSTMLFYGFEQEQSQPADKIAEIKKNMDAMIKTVIID